MKHYYSTYIFNFVQLIKTGKITASIKGNVLLPLIFSYSRVYLFHWGNLSGNQQISVNNITKLYYYMILHPFYIMSLLCHVYTYKNAVKGMHTQIKSKLVMFFIICLSFLHYCGISSYFDIRLLYKIIVLRLWQLQHHRLITFMLDLCQRWKYNDGNIMIEISW